MHCIEINAYAKINLFLEVTARRGDGYHELATLFARVSLCDRLRLEKTKKPGITLKLANSSNLKLSNPADNIVYKAAEKFFAAFDIKPAVKITLRKRVPVGAGLGGGSSDAAAALQGLRRLYGISLKKSLKTLCRLALELGSDVPFFFLGKTFALGRGRGEILSPLKARGSLPQVLLVYPGEPVYTKEVYARLKLGAASEINAKLKDCNKLAKLLEKGCFTASASALLFNRLETPVLPVHKKVAGAKKNLLALGTEAVLMSGSGAVVFALVWNRPAARKMAALLSKRRGYRVFLSNFC
ncbi:MAG TPA: 4-(cytidine 5'-diphospho)-2-C-methyl-D-erythritol kinase [Elusimicrobia bacterium]|nr:4-(cytidine 5'-diphospho)-2-C-methyl-D-erythritol kinase [Elusimicrobiota bacterium]